MLLLLLAFILLYLLFVFPFARALHRGLELAREPETRLTPTPPGVFFRRGVRSALPWWLLTVAGAAMVCLLAVPLLRDSGNALRKPLLLTLEASLPLVVVLLYATIAVLLLAPRWRNTWGVAALALVMGFVLYVGLWIGLDRLLPDIWHWRNHQGITPNGGPIFYGYSLIPAYQFLAALTVLVALVLRIHATSPRWYRLPEE